MPSHRNIQFGMQSLVAGASPAFGGVAFYLSAANLTGAPPSGAIDPVTGDFIVAIDRSTAALFYRITSSGFAVEYLFADDESNNVIKIVATKNAIYWQTSTGRLKRWTEANGTEWGFLPSTDQSGETLLDFIAWTTADGNDRLFAVINDSSTFDAAIFEVDAEDPNGTNAVGQLFNMQNTDTGATKYEITLDYDPVNNRLMFTCGAWAGTSNQYVALFDPDDVSSGALINDKTLNYSPSTDAANTRRKIMYDHKNNQYVLCIDGSAGGQYIGQISTSLAIVADVASNWGDGEAAGMDSSGNIYLWDETSEKIRRIDDTLTSDWQVGISQTGLSSIEIENVTVNDKGQMYVVCFCNDTTYDWIAVMCVPSNNPAGYSFTFNSPNASATTINFNSESSDTLSATSNTLSDASVTYNQTEYASLSFGGVFYIDEEFTNDLLTEVEI